MDKQSPDEKRLETLKDFLAQEQASEKPSELYINDLNGEIKRLEKRLGR